MASGFSCYSQNDEDGISLYILDAAGAPTKRFVELGIGDGRECNCAVLALALGWSGLLVDGDAAKVAYAQRLYERRLQRQAAAVKIFSGWVDRESIIDLLRHHGFAGEIDVLSIDIDGMDYWVWKSIDVVKPRVVILEFQPGLGPDVAMAMRYAPDFDRFAHSPDPCHYGASLRAISELGDTKGYGLVAIDTGGSNAFLVSREVLRPPLVEATPRELFAASRLRPAI